MWSEIDDPILDFRKETRLNFFFKYSATRKKPLLIIVQSVLRFKLTNHL